MPQRGETSFMAAHIAWSTERWSPHAQWRGRLWTFQPYLRHKAFLKAPLCKKRSLFFNGQVDTHKEAPFSLAHSIKSCWRWGRLLKMASASSRWLSYLAFHTQVLMALVAMFVVTRSDTWRAIIATIGAVILLDASKLCSASEEGIVSPNPPNLVGSAKRECSILEQDVRPVMAGMNFFWTACSWGSKRWPIPGIVYRI